MDTLITRAINSNSVTRFSHNFFEAMPPEELSLDSPPPEEAYIRVKLLGKGSFGEAVLYRKTGSNALVVWKEINLRDSSSKTTKEVENEIEILSLLSHPNIVAYYNHYFADTMLYIEMEYANGGTLFHKIASQKSLFLEETVLWYLYQIVSAMSYIHKRNILHRDVKTLNIFLTKSGLVKMGDFGMSKLLEGESRMAETVVGTPYYMSPELIKGSQYNSKSDMWAVGCVIHEVLTLEKTFMASDPNKRASADELLLHALLQVREREFSSKILNLAPESLNNQAPTSASNKKGAQYGESETVPVITSATSETAQHGKSGTEGELGHGDQAAYKQPKLVTALEAVKVVSVACGLDFTVCATENGSVFTFGSNYYGCMGCGDESIENQRSPYQIELFNVEPVKFIACGDHHVISVTNENRVYSWGYGEFGLKKDKDFVYDTSYTSVPTLVKSLCRHKIKSVASGRTHSAVIDDFGNVYAFGCNEFGQLGQGDRRVYDVPRKVRGTLTEHRVVKIACGDGFTIAATSDNQVYAWGWGENGRLGLDHSFSQSNSKSVICATLPRPTIFGMCMVSILESRGWSTVLVSAGGGAIIGGLKIAEETAIARSFELIPDSSGGSSEIQTNKRHNAATGSRSNTVPSWLKQELEGAEVIPFQTQSGLKGGPSPVGQYSNKTRMKGTAENLEELVRNLRVENETLKVELQNKEIRIKSLQEQLQRCRCKKNMLENDI